MTSSGELGGHAVLNRRQSPVGGIAGGSTANGTRRQLGAVIASSWLFLQARWVSPRVVAQPFPSSSAAATDLQLRIYYRGRRRLRFATALKDRQTTVTEGISPTVARRRLRLALREARETASPTQLAVAEQMDWSLSKMIRIENDATSGAVVQRVDGQGSVSHDEAETEWSSCEMSVT
jgi:hypothetical protein